MGVMNFKMIFWCSVESKPSSHISIKIKILFQTPIKLREVMIAEKHRGGGGSCVASKAASHFLGGEGLPRLHLSLFHVSCAHKLLLSVVVREGCLCVYFKCVFA